MGATSGGVLDMPDLTSRRAEEVVRDHLWQSSHGSIDQDLRRNYSEKLVLLTGRGTFRGHEGLRQLNASLNRELPGARFDYRTLLAEGEIAFVEWTARTEDARVTDGADSYLVRDGRIIAQTIHYTVRRRGDGEAAP